MEYLVTMTTNVPDSASDQEVEELRGREAAHTRELARAARVLRLWRPPLKEGEWRTLGLFDASDADDLEKTLASMPLRVWRTDRVTPLAPHPNDPGRDRVSLVSERAEFLTLFKVKVPPAASSAAVIELTAREADLASLPMAAWLDVETTPLGRHPSDPPFAQARNG